MKQRLFSAVNLSLFSIALVGLVYLILYLYSNRLINEYKAELPPAGNFIEVDGYRIHFIKKGSGPQMVLLHGTKGNHAEFSSSLIDNLSKHFEVFLLDRPGYGYSDEPVSALDLQSGTELIEHTFKVLGITQPVILGSSYGASFAVKYASENSDNVRALILLTPEFDFSDNERHPFESVYNMPVFGKLMLNSLYVPHMLLIDKIERQREKEDGVRYKKTMDRFSCLPSEYKISVDEMDNFKDEMRLLYVSANKINIPSLSIFDSYENLDRTKAFIKYMNKSSYLIYDSLYDFEKIVTDILYFINNNNGQNNNTKL